MVSKTKKKSRRVKTSTVSPISRKQKVKTLVVQKKMKDKTIKDKQGIFFSESHYDAIIKSDCDVYREDEDGQQHLLLKFRKKVIPTKMCQVAFRALEKEAKKKHPNRGAAAGLVDIKNLPHYVGEIVKVDKYRVFYKHKKDGKLAKDNISNMVSSSIIGYFDRVDRNSLNSSNSNNKKNNNDKIPCRTTKFTMEEVEKWNIIQPLIKKIDSLFKKLVPKRHSNQLNRAKETPNFQIGNTAFSTITLNYNFRTATHQDKGDYPEGFGNLVVLENPNNKYKGGYTGFPQFKVAVDVRQGDFFAFDIHQWHCNTSITGKTKLVKKRGKDKKGNWTTRMVKEPLYGRLSVVCYLRKNMIKCKKTK
tara:strand:- start:64 stop:1146 length:1083 start_codon:yes stop_codon:yes gene_type:complete